MKYWSYKCSLGEHNRLSYTCNKSYQLQTFEWYWTWNTLWGFKVLFPLKLLEVVSVSGHLKIRVYQQALKLLGGWYLFRYTLEKVLRTWLCFMNMWWEASAYISVLTLQFFCCSVGGSRNLSDSPSRFNRQDCTGNSKPTFISHRDSKTTESRGITWLVAVSIF